MRQTFPFLSQALDTGTIMALQGIPEKSPGDLSAQVPTDRSFKVLEVDNVCCFEGLDFLNSRAVVRGTSSSAADRRALVQET